MSGLRLCFYAFLYFFTIVAIVATMVRMKAVGIKALKNELSHYLRLVKEGERIFITDRDEVIAELRQPSMSYVGSVSKFDSFMTELVQKGEGTKASLLLADTDIHDGTLSWEGVSAVDALNSSREDRD